MRTLLQCTTLSEGVRQTDRQRERVRLCDDLAKFDSKCNFYTLDAAAAVPLILCACVRGWGCRAVAAIRAANGKGEKLYIPDDMTVISFVSSTEHLF